MKRHKATLFLAQTANRRQKGGENNDKAPFRHQNIVNIFSLVPESTKGGKYVSDSTQRAFFLKAGQIAPLLK